ncbi:Uncharacterised protein [Mycobacteroides abscessus subsp. abscessus]|nr:Uncharacterised protein [Mycobacteroides abscessus subsp. abscessus]
MTEHDDPDKHGQTAGRRDQQGLHRRAPTREPFGVMPDQEEGQHRRQLPEDVEHQQVVTDYQAEHGAGERHQLGSEARQAWFGVPVAMPEVACAIEQHQRPDTEHEHAHDRGQRVESQGDVHCELGHPRDVDADTRTVARPSCQHPDQRTKGNQGQGIEGQSAHARHK